VFVEKSKTAASSSSKFLQAAFAFNSETRMRPLGSKNLVCHRTNEYARGIVHVNTAESSHALIRRGLIGIYHNVSREYVHRYLWQFDFLWNNRQLNDVERTIAAVKAAEGKRLMYRDPVAEREYIKTREQKESGEQLEPF
jgi:hypothetical protein